MKLSIDNQFHTRDLKTDKEGGYFLHTVFTACGRIRKKCQTMLYYDGDACSHMSGQSGESLIICAKV